MGMLGGLLGGSDDKGIKRQQKDNARRQAFIEEQQKLARGDASALFPYSMEALSIGSQAAIDQLAKSMPYQMQAYQGGNVAAQDMLAGGRQQYQNAILGMPVDNAAFSSYNPDMPAPASYGATVPNFGTITTPTAPEGSLTYTPAQQQQQQQQQQGGMTPSDAMNAYNNYQNFSSAFATPMVGGGAAASVPTAGSMSGIGAAANSSAVGGGYGAFGASAPAAFPAGAMAPTGAGAGGAGGAGAGGGSALASAGPWAALAAAIAGNEKYQVQHGNRSSDTGERWGDALTGKVLSRDADEYLGKVPGAQWSARWGSPQGLAKNVQGLSDPREHWKDTKKWGGKIGDLLGGIF